MGEKKAIIFRRTFPEEVDAVCSRAIIIDRGKIVANGTPAELRQRSEFAGAVTLRVTGVNGAIVTQELEPAFDCQTRFGDQGNTPWE